MFLLFGILQKKNVKLFSYTYLECKFLTLIYKFLNSLAPKTPLSLAPSSLLILLLLYFGCTDLFLSLLDQLLCQGLCACSFFWYRYHLPFASFTSFCQCRILREAFFIISAPHNIPPVCQFPFPTLFFFSIIYQ